MKKYLTLLALVLFAGTSSSYALLFDEEESNPKPRSAPVKYDEPSDEQIERSIRRGYSQMVPDEERSKKFHAKTPGFVQTSQLDEFGDDVVSTSSRVSKVLQDIAETTKKFAEAAVPIVVVLGSIASTLVSVGVVVAPLMLAII